ncbi:MAG: hypothetical protein AAF658_11875 [Myxococcota bacterium]
MWRTLQWVAICAAFLSVAAPLSAQTASHILRWGEVPGASGYLIEIAEDAEFSRVIDRKQTKRTSLKWEPPSEYVSYFFRVAGVARSGQRGAFSPPRETGPVVAIPDATSPPDGSRATWRSEAPGVELKWSPSDSAGGYVVETAGDALVIQSETAASSLLVHPKRLGSFRWRVAARSPSGSTSAFSGWRSVLVVLGTPIPDSPVSASRINVDVGDAVELAWSAGPGRAFEVQVSKRGDFDETGDQTTRLAGPEKTAKFEISSRGDWYWRVRAFDDSGTPTPWSSTVSFVAFPTRIEPPVARVPTDGEVLTFAQGATVSFGWASTDTEYEVQIASNSDFNSPEEHRLDVSLLDWSTPRPGTYFWRVRARNGDDVLSEWSSPRQFEVLPRVERTPLPPEPEPAPLPVEFFSLVALWVGAKIGLRNDLAPAVATRFQLDAFYPSDALFVNSFIAVSLGIGVDGRDDNAALEFESSLRRFPLDVIAGLRLPVEPFTFYGGAGVVLEPYRGRVRVDGFPEQRQNGIVGGPTLRGGITLDVRYAMLFAELGYSFVSRVEELLTLGGTALTVSVGVRVAPF